MIKPKKLKKGDTIGIISPSSFTGNRSDFRRACAYLEDMGYNLVIGDHVNRTRGFTSGTEDERAADFNAMFRNDRVDAVMASMGGYGSAQFIRKIDFDVVRANPKIFCGFSDITSLHLALNKYADLVTFHGPGAAGFTSDYITAFTREYFLKAVSSTEPVGEVRLTNAKKRWLVPLHGGVCEGPVVGGNLTLVCASLGTPYEIDTAGKILFFEEVDSEPWVIDHCMSHLRNAGKLDDVLGVAVGECVGCEPYDHKPGYCVDTPIEDVLVHYLEPLGVPVLYGMAMGHGNSLATLPLGVRVRVDADAKKFTILESGVSE